jgi:predicted nucleic acid-binding protein
MTARGVPADSSAIIYLAKAGGLAAAHSRFGPLLMPPAVWAEVVIAGLRAGRTEVAAVEKAVENGHVQKAALDGTVRKRAHKLAQQFGLGAGESEVLALGHACELVLIDEHRATRAARVLGVCSVETALVPAFCVQAGVLDAAAALELLDAIGRHTKVRVELVIRVRQLIEEVKP